MELQKLITEIEERIQDVKDDYQLNIDVKDALLRENKKFLVRTQQLLLGSELFCEKIKNERKDK